jgi:hypothetical protein
MKSCSFETPSKVLQKLLVFQLHNSNLALGIQVVQRRTRVDVYSFIHHAER